MVFKELPYRVQSRGTKKCLTQPLDPFGDPKTTIEGVKLFLVFRNSWAVDSGKTRISVGKNTCPTSDEDNREVTNSSQKAEEHGDLEFLACPVLDDVVCEGEEGYINRRDKG